MFIYLDARVFIFIRNPALCRVYISGKGHQQRQRHLLHLSDSKVANTVIADPFSADRYIFLFALLDNRLSLFSSDSCVRLGAWRPDCWLLPFLPFFSFDRRCLCWPSSLWLLLLAHRSRYRIHPSTSRVSFSIPYLLTGKTFNRPGCCFDCSLRLFHHRTTHPTRLRLGRSLKSFTSLPSSHIQSVQEWKHFNCH